LLYSSNVNKRRKFSEGIYPVASIKEELVRFKSISLFSNLGLRERKSQSIKRSHQE
jgi:hypothetical protein